MEIIPAIDLKGGKGVRLYQGDFAQETVYSHNPVEIALRWQEMGALRIHIVDLDGAAKGEPVNLPTVLEIVRRVSLPVQLGGGIRRLNTVEQLLAKGINRVILGTAAIEDTGLVQEACQRFGEAIAIAIDARDGKVATWGWQRPSNITALELAEQMAALGARRFIYTDISRDGTLTQPNFEAIAEMVSKTRLPVIASGGISTIEHLNRLQGLGAEGAIVGKALYTGDLSLPQALAALQEKQARKLDPQDGRQ